MKNYALIDYLTNISSLSSPPPIRAFGDRLICRVRVLLADLRVILPVPILHCVDCIAVRQTECLHVGDDFPCLLYAWGS